MRLKSIIIIVLSTWGGNLLAGVPVENDFRLANIQARRMLEKAPDPGLHPHAGRPGGEVHFIRREGWTSGFFAGVLWQLYRYGNDSKWKEEAERRTWVLEPLRNFKGHHDVGFMVNCSFGNGYALTGDPAYRQVLLDAAESLASRFSPRVGSIRSWDTSDNDSSYLVIIDNMMNLELLFRAWELGGGRHLYDIAVSHADSTMKHHYRDDASSYHVVDYDPVSGVVQDRRTSQGLADGSSWSRGQAWGLYGFTMCYRETGDVKYLDHARRIAEFMLCHPNVPEDMVFYWDFDAPDIPNAPRDASAAAITASALLELYGFTSETLYFRAAEKLLSSLSATPYLSEPGANSDFILTGSTGALPAGSEISVPLIYADYYFLEALNRYSRMEGPGTE